MSQSEIVRFPKSPLPHHENNPDGAKEARRRIAGLRNPYLAHAAPAKEDLVGAINPVSPAAEAADGKPATPSTPFTLNSSSEATQVSDVPLTRETVIPELAHLLPPVQGAPVEPKTTAQPAPTVTPANPLEQLAAPTGKVAHSRRERPEAPPKSLPSRFMPIIVGVVTFVLVLLVAKAPVLLNQFNYLTHGKSANATVPPAAQTNAVAVSADPVISIPKINVSAPVIYTDNNAESVIQKHLESGVVHYANTALPGTNGNSVIFGHSSNDWWEPGDYKFVFVLLDKLAVNDTFTVNYNSKQYVYQVTSTKVVPPSDLSVLNPTSEPTMTLITCTPPGTSWQRLIVTAKQISPATNGEAVTAQKPAKVVSGDNKLPGNAPSIGQHISKWWNNLIH